MIISAVLLLVMALSPLMSARAASPAALSPLTSQTFDEVGYFYNGYACVVKGDDAGYLDKAGVFHKTYKLSDVMANRTESVASHLGYIDHTALTMSKEGLYPYFDSATNGWGVKNINTGAIILPAENLLPTIYRCGRGIVVNLYYASERDGGTQLLSNDWNANAGGGGYSELASS